MAAASRRPRFRASNTTWRGSAWRAPASRDRITLLLEDYRDLTGVYDALVSIEMIEAVGHQYLDTYFRRCSGLLKPDGRHAAAGHHHPRSVLRSGAAHRWISSSASFSRAASSPRCKAMLDSAARADGYEAVPSRGHRPALCPHLADVARAVPGPSERVRALGYPETFVRMWEFYLCYCEGGFEERQLGDVQMLLTKPRSRRASDCHRACLARLIDRTLAELKASPETAHGSSRRSDVAPFLIDFRASTMGSDAAGAAAARRADEVARNPAHLRPRGSGRGAARRQYQLLRRRHAR